MISLRPGSQRNTKCYELRLGSSCFYISYSTIIGASLDDGDTWRTVRLDNVWGPTTGRHMNEMGIRGYEVISDEEMQRLINQSIIKAGQQLALSHLKGNQ